MGALINQSTARNRRQTRPDHQWDHQELNFLEKESQFFIRLLNECKSKADQENALVYQDLIERFRDFKEAANKDDPSSGGEMTFNALNQTLVRTPGKAEIPRDYDTFRRSFNNLKEEAFRKIGSIFSIRIR